MKLPFPGEPGKAACRCPVACVSGVSVIWSSSLMCPQRLCGGRCSPGSPDRSSRGVKFGAPQPLDPAQRSFLDARLVRVTPIAWRAKLVFTTALRAPSASLTNFMILFRMILFRRVRSVSFSRSATLSRASWGRCRSPSHGQRCPRRRSLP